MSRINVRTTEVMVYHYPEGMEGWRLFRFEYGFESGVEAMLWFPPQTTIEEIEKIENMFIDIQESDVTKA